MEGTLPNNIKTRQRIRFICTSASKGTNLSMTDAVLAGSSFGSQLNAISAVRVRTNWKQVPYPRSGFLFIQWLKFRPPAERTL